MTSDDEAIRALYGKHYGPAHQDRLQGDESARSADDPSRRLQADDLSGQAGYAPARAIFGEVDPYLGIRSSAAGLPPIVEPAPTLEAADVPDEPEVDPVAVDDPEPGIDCDLREWIAANPDAVLTTPTLLTDALHLVEGHINRADEMELADAMGRLGYAKTQRRIDGARAWVWVAATPAVTDQ
ncbi:hypothetical protein [Burkholderia sp. RF2-non_BP3]|uniref:hypothetical protein n=1 Tax=Burkholderia sp. RF2-non_BP3 TaxID=1637844 RepID=UPI00075585D5|nr:hypothetical protein [Burkholderia sp. RF2-non_BP3]KUY52378.1 hypothetical protein WS45_24985 [Burkholderia sp. RF2-non_BP3]